MASVAARSARSRFVFLHVDCLLNAVANCLKSRLIVDLTAVDLGHIEHVYDLIQISRNLGPVDVEPGAIDYGLAAPEKTPELSLPIPNCVLTNNLGKHF